MNRTYSLQCAAALFAFALCTGLPAAAQQAATQSAAAPSSAAQRKDFTPESISAKAGPNPYQASRETVVSGKVVSYSNAVISLQTSSGTISVQAGNPHMLSANNFSVKSGDSLTITGENLTLGAKQIFAARVLQKGTQSLIVRSRNGSPLLPISRNANGNIVAAGAKQ
jgi:hypothetical protein